MSYGLTYQIKYPVSSLNSRDNGKIVVCNIIDTTSYGPLVDEYIVDMDTLNGKLYLGLKSSSQGYFIVETDGTNFTTIISNTGSWALNSLKSFKKTKCQLKLEQECQILEKIKHLGIKVLRLLKK